MDDWFPVAEARPVTVRLALSGLSEDEQNVATGHCWIDAKAGSKTLAALERTPQGATLHGFMMARRLAYEGVAGTIQTGGVAFGYPGSSWPSHPTQHRGISAREAARLASFPDSFSFGVNWRDGARRIGNSVPPLFMRAIARNIKAMLQTGQPHRQPSAKMDYLALLDAAWRDAIAPREANAPTVISTFAGGGGSSLGYMMAGYRELLAVEWDDNAVATLRLNFPDLDIYHGDIAALTVDEVLERTGLQPGELDVLDGSPPCQGFSTAGKRQIDDPRNQLFREYVRLLRGLRPKVFVMENVSGMVKGKMKLVFVEILRELKASGYRVSARLLNAMYFNVPQSRERMIFIGVRDDLDIEPSHPKAEAHRLCALCATEGIEDTPNPYGPRNFNQARRFLRHHEPAPTLTRSEVPGSDLPFAGKARIGDRRAAALASFPLAYRFTGNWKDAVNRIGNSVPPLFMRSIARHIREAILDAATAPAERVGAGA